MRHLLLHPPFADPTQPYLSLPTLKAALRERGLDARVVDLNVEAAHWLFERETLESLAARVSEHSTDHPGESTEEALATVRWIEESEESVDLFLVGRFGLEMGSHIAQEPERYGVEEVFHAAGDDLRLYALFRQTGGPRSPSDEEEIESAIDRVAAGYELHPYPWAGAISTHHTFLHFLRFGPRVFRRHFQAARARSRPPIGALAGEPSFPVELIADREERFLRDWLARALYTTWRGRSQTSPLRQAPISLADFETESRRIAPLRRTPARL